MLILNLLFSIAMGIVLAILFTAGFAQGARPFSPRWWADVGAFFMLIFVSTWAAGVWLPAPSLLVGVLLPLAAAGAIAVIYSMASKHRVVHDPSVVRAGPNAVRASAAVQSTMFTVLMFFLAVVVAAGYWLVNRMD